MIVVEDDDEDYSALDEAFAAVAPESELVRFGSGAELFDRVQDLQPLVLLLHLDLLDGSGLRVLHRLRTHPRWRIVPVVVYSGSDEPDDVAAAYVGGASGYLVKPRNRQEWEASVQGVWTYWTEVVRPAPTLDPGGSPDPMTADGSALR